MRRSPRRIASEQQPPSQAGSQEEQTIVLAASVPLTGEPGWRALDEGEVVVATDGRIVPL